jgi:uncharacterized protein (AIM24 family)
MSTLPPPTATLEASYTCPYCRLESDGSATSCVHCGAPVDVRARTSLSGWQAQPPIRDMARIQFGQSTCQISGNYVPAAEFRLGGGDRIFFSHHVLLWADRTVSLGNQSIAGGWKRMRAGLPLVMMEATGPGALALSDDAAGETIAVPLMPGRGIDVREHRFLTATANVGYQWFQSAMWYKTRNGDETETHYPTGMYLDRFSATTTPGLLVLHSPGNVFVRDLAEGQTICVHPGAFLWKDETVQMALHVERPGGGFWSSNWQPATPFARFVGPGRVAVSSAYERSEGTGRITSTSPATSTDWGQQGFSVAAAAMGQPVDDSRVRAGVGAFLTASGFSEADHDLQGPTATTTYAHPSGMKVAVTVMSGAALVNLAQNVAGMLGGSAIAQRLAKRAGDLTASLSNRVAAHGGAPVEGFGVPAQWTAQPGAAHLFLSQNQQQIIVAVEGNLSTDDQWAWAANIGRAALAGA